MPGLWFLVSVVLALSSFSTCYGYRQLKESAPVHSSETDSALDVLLTVYSAADSTSVLTDDEEVTVGDVSDVVSLNGIISRDVSTGDEVHEIDDGGVNPQYGTVVLPHKSLIASSPFNCSGWPEERTYVEAQQWYTADKKGAVVQQLKLGTCLPVTSNLSDIVYYDMLVQAVNANISGGRASVIAQAGDIVSVLAELVQTVSCNGTGVCSFTVRLAANTSKVADGPYTVKLRFFPQFRDSAIPIRLFVGLDWSVLVLNSPSAYTGRVPPSTVSGIGYGGSPWNYVLATWMGGLPSVPVPQSWWSAPIRTYMPGSTASVTQTTIYIAPNSSANSAVSVLMSTPGPYQGSVLTAGLNSTGVLPYVFVIRADSYVPAKGRLNTTAGTVTGCLLFPFLVIPSWQA